ncbi:MAG: HD domain-containing protein [Clostridia bacterium]|nr:HD domain-containing protein [Clostridia bacterium]
MNNDATNDQLELLMKENERLRKQLEFSLEIDKEKTIFRQTHLSNHGRNENDSEHAWHMAIMAYILREYSNKEIDIAKVMLMCLIHDVVEIDAGDTYAYDPEGLKTQKEREEKAKNRIFGMLPEDQKNELISIWEEFEEYETAESKFAHCMDNVQPLLLNNSNDGMDWVEHDVNELQVRGRQGKNIEGSRMLYKLTDAIIKRHVDKGHL